MKKEIELIEKYKKENENIIIPVYFGIDETDNKPVLDEEGMLEYFEEEIKKLYEKGFKEGYEN